MYKDSNMASHNGKIWWNWAQSVKVKNMQNP